MQTCAFLQGAYNQICMCQRLYVCDRAKWVVRESRILLSFMYARADSRARWLEYFQFAYHSSGMAKINYNKTPTPTTIINTVAATFTTATTTNKLWQQFDFVIYLYAKMNFWLINFLLSSFLLHIFLSRSQLLYSIIFCIRSYYIWWLNHWSR